mmetsp:Transcript_25807/g.35471  ORF Transcript_25807/g.35471 Transcript_25807/m.35471 type:complete len:103 (-) Transcript_25807:213-521(-)
MKGVGEQSWPTLMALCLYIILMPHPKMSNYWTGLTFFVKKNGLKDEQCMIFAHRSADSNERFRPPPLFSRVSAALTGPQSGADVKSLFENFLNELFTLKQRK